MNWNQLKALVWLRWRLFMVQFRKMNIWIKILLGLIALSVTLTSVGGTIFAFTGTLYLMPEDKPRFALLALDGMVCVFLFAWIAGFMSELQREEPISIEKLLHLPMSVRGAFLLNYLSSFASLTIVALLPAMIGFCCALPFVFGWRTLLGLPLLFALMLFVTAVTYQVRGWLARMMANPKRRRAIMTGLFMAFIGLTQLPGMLTFVFDDDDDKNRDRNNVAQVETTTDPGSVAAIPDEKSLDIPPTSTEVPSVDAVENDEPVLQEVIETEEQVISRTEARQARRARKLEKAMGLITHLNRYIPFGWLPLGVLRAAEGILWPGILGLVGLLGLSAVSLNMSYRATLNFYRGTTRKKKGGTGQSAGEQESPSKIRDLKPLPLLPPRLGTIVRANLMNMWRTPAVKMQLLVPFFVMFFPLFAVVKNHDELPDDVAPLVGTGVVLFCMFMMFGLSMNIFGFDRHGFRSFMLLPVRPRELLLAKNISMFPIICIMGFVPFCFAAVLFSFTWHDALACAAQLVTAFTLFCTLGNVVSTMFPFPMPTSSMKRVKPKWQAMLAQLGAFLISPLLMIVVALPAIAAFGLKKMDIWTGFSLNLPLSLVITALATGFYWLMLEPMSRLLWNKQRDILLEVTKTE